MTRALRIYLIAMPLAAAAGILFALSWYLPAALCALGAIAALVMSRRAVRTQFEDDAIRDNNLIEDEAPPKSHAS